MARTLAEPWSGEFGRGHRPEFDPSRHLSPLDMVATENRLADMLGVDPSPSKKTLAPKGGHTRFQLESFTVPFKDLTTGGRRMRNQLRTVMPMPIRASVVGSGAGVARKPCSSVSPG